MIIRVRLKFDSTPVSYAQKCWFVFDDESCRLVSDVSHLIASHFGLQNRHGIQVKGLLCTRTIMFAVRYVAVIELKVYPAQ